jgi:flagellar export protein FliJ
MKKFQFSLEPLRVLRKQKERTAQQRYARALALSDQAATQLQKATDELAGAYENIVHELAHGLSAAQIMGLRNWCTVLEIRRNESRAALEETRRATEKAFKEMVAAARERESLDRFYEKSREAYDREALREEQKNLDEMAIQMSNGSLLFQMAGAEYLN